MQEIGKAETPLDAAPIVVYKGNPTDLENISTSRANERGKAKMKEPMAWEENMDVLNPSQDLGKKWRSIFSK